MNTGSQQDTVVLSTDVAKEGTDAVADLGNIHRLLKIGPDPAPDEIDEGAFTLNGDHIDGILDDARR